MERYGQIIGLKPDQVEAYERIHAEVWPEVLAMIAECNMHNYTIFRHGLILFAYFEYTGDDFAQDMAKMVADPKTREWWFHTAPMQEPVEDRETGEWWATMKKVFHAD